VEDRVRFTWSLCFWLGIVLIVSGCANNPMVLQGKVAQLEQQQQTAQRQYQQLQDRANALDRDNQELSSLLAQARQQAKVSEDQLALLRDQLRDVNTQLAQVKTEKESADKRAQAVTASMQRQTGISINPNNSFLQVLPAANIPNVSVRRDGDVIRIEIPASVLFESGSSRLRPGGTELIANVAAEIARTYPDQIIGIEGHTDNDPVAGSASRNGHDLSVARALSVYDVLVSRTQLKGSQLFVAGHGPNRPIVSNGTVEGQQRNRRVELVIYPERG